MRAKRHNHAVYCSYSRPPASRQSLFLYYWIILGAQRSSLASSLQAPAHFPAKIHMHARRGLFRLKNSRTRWILYCLTFAFTRVQKKKKVARRCAEFSLTLRITILAGGEVNYTLLVHREDNYACASRVRSLVGFFIPARPGVMRAY